eukprot:6571166-Prymnesium_polylepis.1
MHALEGKLVHRELASGADLPRGRLIAGPGHGGALSERADSREGDPTNNSRSSLTHLETWRSSPGNVA